MPLEIREPRDCQRLGAVRAHCQGVSVAESERHARCQPQWGQELIEFREARHTLQAQQLEGDGPGVFGVRMDRAALQRGEQDRGVAEPLAVAHPGFTCCRHGAGHDLGQDVGLGEALGADIDDGLGQRQGGRQQERDH